MELSPREREMLDEVAASLAALESALAGDDRRAAMAAARSLEIDAAQLALALGWGRGL